MKRPDRLPQAEIDRINARRAEALGLAEAIGHIERGEAEAPRIDWPDIRRMVAAEAYQAIKWRS